MTSYIRICIGYKNELFAYVRLLGFVKVKLYPSKEKKKTKKLTAKKLRALQEKERKKSKKQAKVDKADETEEEKVKPGELVKDIGEIIKELYELVCEILKRFSYKLKIRIRHLNVTVSTDDAAKTALVYSGVCNTMNLLIDMLRVAEKVKFSFDDVDCKCDFSKEKFDIKADIIIKIRVISMLSGAIGTLMTYIKKKL